jgi:hypothetical protein
VSVATECQPVLGDWVRTTDYGHVGRVYAIHHYCPENKRWLACQTIPVPAELVRKPWCSVLVHGGGAVVVPIGLCSVLDDHPKRIRHPGADLYFREEVECE